MLCVEKDEFRGYSFSVNSAPEAGVVSFLSNVELNHLAQKIVRNLLLKTDSPEFLCTRVSTSLNSVREGLKSRNFDTDEDIDTGYRKTNDKGPMVGKHWLIPLDLCIKLRKAAFHPLEELNKLRCVVRIRNMFIGPSDQDVFQSTA